MGKEVRLNPVKRIVAFCLICSAHRPDRPTAHQCVPTVQDTPIAMCAQPVVAVPLQLTLFLGIILCIQLAFATAFVVKFRLRQPPLCGWTEARALRVCTSLVSHTHESRHSV